MVFLATWVRLDLGKTHVVVRAEVRDKYRDISLAINIAGFEAYRCISDVY